MTSIRRNPPQVAAVRRLVWPVGGAALGLSLSVVRVPAQTTYGGTWLPLLWLEVAAALGLLVAATLIQPSLRAVALAVAGTTWLVPELAGWASGPVVLGTAADAWSRVLPALLLAGALSWRGEPWARGYVVLAVAGGSLAAGARVLLVDPFLDPDCWRRCDHNPISFPGRSGAGELLDAGGSLLLAAAAVGGVALLMVRGHGRNASAIARTSGWSRVAVSALVIGLAVPVGLRVVVSEAATRPGYLACFLLAQAGALGLAALAVRDRALQWRLSLRLARLAGLLAATPAPGAPATSLAEAVPDPGLEVRYWAAGRAEFVTAEGEPITELEPGPDRRVTQVRRGGQSVAALVHSAGVDGERLDRALGAALRLALENEQLRAATLAELGELNRSRARIVERAQVERRRLERNLHDGAQQRVVALALLVRMLAARADIIGNVEDTACAGRAVALTRAAVEELRRVARGIYPAVLADAGLAGAVADLAESSTELAVTVDVLPSARYTGTVETTAYLVIAAAIAEARNAGAEHLRVSGAETGGRLRVELADGAAPGPRSAVTQLGDQVRALAGELVVEPHGSGTRVRLELPCVS
jgi:signal transduction histidine kinase